MPLQFIFHLIIFVIGVPLNLTTALVLMSNKQLYNARNAIWLGIIFSNFLVFLLIPLEYWIFYQHSYTACRFRPHVCRMVDIWLWRVLQVDEPLLQPIACAAGFNANMLCDLHCAVPAIAAVPHDLMERWPR